MAKKTDAIPYITKKEKYARRVIKINGSCYINLPRPWCKRNFVKKGDIVHIDIDKDQGNLAITAVYPGSDEDVE